MLKNNLNIILIIVLALALRLVGAQHGLPFVFHPDEPTIVRSALGIRFDPNPNHFDWPTMYIYINFFMFMAFSLFRNLVPALGNFMSEPAVFYFLARNLTGVLGALTLVPVYLAGKELFDKKTGLISALVLGITPYHIWHSHYALADVPMGFFVAWVMYFSVLALKKGSAKYYVFAGLFVGFAASTKYNGGLAALLVALGFLLSFDVKKIWSVFLSGVSAVIGFLIGTPYALLDWETFSGTKDASGAFWQFTNVGNVSFREHLEQFWNAITYKLPDDFGYIFFYIFLVVVFLTLFASVVSWLNSKIYFKDKKALLLLVVPAITIIFYISGFEKVRSHYFFVVYPMVAVCVGYLLNLLHNKFSVIVLLAFLSVPFILALSKTYTFYNNDTRLLAYNYLSKSDRPVVYLFSGFRDVAHALPGKSYTSLKKVPAGVSVNLVADEPQQLANQRYISNLHRVGPPIYIYEN